MLRTISVPAVRANCLNALEPVICSTTDFSRRCELRGCARADARTSRSCLSLSSRPLLFHRGLVRRSLLLQTLSLRRLGARL